MKFRRIVVKVDVYEDEGPFVCDSVVGRWEHDFSGEALMQSRLSFPKAVASVVEHVLTTNDVESHLVKAIEEEKEVLALEAERKRIDLLLREKRGR